MSDTAELRRVAVVTGGSRGIGRAVCCSWPARAAVWW